MTGSGMLALAILMPLVGACLIGIVAAFGNEYARAWALVVTLATLVVAGSLCFGSLENASLSGNWLPEPGLLSRAEADSATPTLAIRFDLGLDGLSVWLFGLSALLMVTCVLVSWTAIKDRPALFYGMLLLLEFGCLGVFAARDLILFYVFFEFTLIPLYFLIGIWGSEQRRYAAIKFFLFTLAGSLLTFLGLLAIVIWHAHHVGDGSTWIFSIPQLTSDLQTAAASGAGMSVGLQLLIFLALFAGFAIKVPLFPLHTWLPLAHVQAPTAGSVVLAGVLLKIGTYGFVRFSIPMLTDAAALCMPWLLWLSVSGIIYGALVALAQTDIKRLIAYSSVSHLGFCMLGIFAFNKIALAGGTLQMVNHGISTGGLFAIVGMLYERYHTREIRELSGLARRTPWLAFFMLVFTFSSIGLPGLNGFVGEFMVLLGMFQRSWTAAPVAWQSQLVLVAILAISGVVLGAWYMLWLVQRVFFGPLVEPNPNGHTVPDMTWREIGALAPLAVFVVWIGLFPKFFLDRMEPALTPITVTAEAALQRQYRPDDTTTAASTAAAAEVLAGRSREVEETARVR